MRKQFAPVAPPQLLARLHEVGDFLVGNYHLLLAHDVAVRPEEYAEVLPENSFVIMDNSLIELGHPCDITTMAAACTIHPRQKWGVGCIVLPDVPHNMDETVRLSRESAKDYSRICITLMAVPQGNSLEEYLECAARLAEIEGVHFWGIPRSVHAKLGTRLELVRAIANKHAPYNTIHLLGFSSDLEDDLKSVKHPFVMGIDSAVPTRMGQSFMIMKRGQHDPGPRGDYWEQSHRWLEPTTIANLCIIRGWING